MIKNPTALGTIVFVFHNCADVSISGMSRSALILLSSFVSVCQCNEGCHSDDMARCTDPLKVVTDNMDLGFATSIEELEKMCP